MKKRHLIWAATAALFVVVTAVIWFVPQNDTNQNPVVPPTPTATQATPEPPPKPTEAPENTAPEPTATSTTTTTVQPTPTPKPTTDTTKKKTGEVFKLKIDGRTISVAYGVDEKTLKKTPGWLTTSAEPGGKGMCVVYGHRNRNHLRLLKDVDIGDKISVQTDIGSFNYIVDSINIFDNNEDTIIPAIVGNGLFISTCYPFHYAGKAPQKYCLTAIMEE